MNWTPDGDDHIIRCGPDSPAIAAWDNQDIFFENIAGEPELIRDLTNEIRVDCWQMNAKTTKSPTECKVATTKRMKQNRNVPSTSKSSQHQPKKTTMKSPSTRLFVISNKNLTKFHLWSKMSKVKKSHKKKVQTVPKTSRENYTGTEGTKKMHRRPRPHSAK